MTNGENVPVKIRLRPVQEEDIGILYEMLKEMLDTPNSSVNESPLVPYNDSEKFVKKYLYDNKNHDIDNWYIVIDENEQVLGSVKISKKNYVSYQILKSHQNKGIASKAVDLLMKTHPRKRYFATINQNNPFSIRLIEKLGFSPKAIVYEKVEN